MASTKAKKRKAAKEKLRVSASSKSSSKWKMPLFMAFFALCLYRGIEYHNYWNSLSPVVEVQQGPVQGRASLTASGKEYFAFQGIPYAAPPLGPLRFSDPQPPLSWAPSVRDARDDGPVCMQPPMKFPTAVPRNISAIDVVRFLGAVPALFRRTVRMLRQSEDCLTLNVFTPKVGDAAALPVLVYYHGGAFVFGDSGLDMLGPQHLVEQDVVVVTANYRLGPLGFLALGEDANQSVGNAPEGVGNAALKDAVAVLVWIRDNIARFGGDPDRVTVAGQSAGGVIAHYLTLLPVTKGLFRHVIAMSGTALHHWGLSTPAKALERTNGLVRRLLRPEMAGGPDGPAAPDTRNPKDVLRFLREVDARLLMDIENWLVKEEESLWLMDEFPFQPTVDGTLLTASPIELIRAGRFHHVPVMLGLTAREGLFAFPSMLAKELPLERQAEIVENDFHRALPDYAREAFPRGSTALEEAKTAVKQFYFGGGAIDKGSLQQFVDFYGSLMFDYDTHCVTKELPKVSSTPVFAYNFTFEGRNNLFRRTSLFHVPEFRGATHCDELAYLFHVDILPQIPFHEDDPETILQEKMVRLISNFVKTGNPTPSVTPEMPFKWPSISRNETPILRIDVSSEIQKDGYKPIDMKLWDSLLKM